MDILKLIVLQLVSPLKFSLLLISLGFLLSLLEKARFARPLYISAVCWILIWSQPYASDVLLKSLEFPPPQEQANNKKAPDYILVLACYYSTQGKVPEISRWHECSLQRNVEAARLHFKSNAPIIVTGGTFLKDKKVNYGERALSFFMSLNVEQSKIIPTYTGTNTSEEIASAEQMLTGKHVWVVSSATHITRVQQHIENLVASVDYFPVDYHSKNNIPFYLTMPSQSALENARLGLYETFAKLKFKLFK